MTTHNVIANKNKGVAAGVVLLVIFLFLFALTPADAEASSPGFGNIDGKESINVNDVVLLMQYVLDLETLDVDQRERADVNGNGFINVQDVTLVMQWVLGLIDEFPVEAVSTDTFFQVEPGQGSISGVNWLSEEEVTITLGDVEIVVDTDLEGNFEIHSWEYEELDPEVGQTVIVKDSDTTKAHIVRDLKITSVDAAADVVYGQAPAGSEVEVRVFDMDRDFADFPIRTVAANNDGEWTADFSEAVGADPSESAFDIGEGVTGEARINDLTRDATHRYWTYGEAAFAVYPDELITGFNWAPNSAVTITVEDDQHEAETDAHGYFAVEVKASAGDTVEVTDGVTTREHVVTDLEVTVVDRDNGVISGTAESQTTVYVELLQPMNGYGPPTLIDDAEDEADLNGEWTVEFEEEIANNIDIQVMQKDDDDDMTIIIK